jgi:hypothetical protein
MTRRSDGITSATNGNTDGVTNSQKRNTNDVDAYVRAQWAMADRLYREERSARMVGLGESKACRSCDELFWADQDDADFCQECIDAGKAL